MEKKRIYVSRENLQRVAEAMQKNPDGKDWIWTSDKDVELPIIMDTAGFGSLPPSTLTQMFSSAVERFPNNQMFLEYDKLNNRWKGITYREAMEKVKELARAIIGSGVPPRSCVTIIGNNSAKWMISFWAAIFANCVPVGIYPTNSAATCSQILEDCKAELSFVEDKEQLDKFRQVRNAVQFPKKIITFIKLDTNENENIFHFDSFLKFSGRVDETRMEEIREGVKPGITALILYTSGSTGVGKGVLLSHDNFCYVCGLFNSLKRQYTGDKRVISYLPLSHVAAVFFECCVPINEGASIYFADKDALKGSLPFYLEKVRPVAFLAVPRIWEKIEDKIRSRVENSNFIRRNLFNWALGVGEREWRNYVDGKPVSKSYRLAKRLVFDKIKKTIGLDQATDFFFGAAPMKVETRKFFCALGMPLNNAYGLTETSGGISILEPHDLSSLKYEGCGKAIRGCYATIGPDEEVILGGRTIFNGYLNREADTKAVVNLRKEFKSGDMGRLDQDMNLFITGRIKELIVTAGGENIAPVPIEEEIQRLIPGIFSATTVIGDQRPYLSVLFFLKNKSDFHSQPVDELDPDVSLALVKYGIIASTISEVLSPVNAVALKNTIENVISQANKKAISNAALVRRWAVMPRDISVPTGELTHTIKLKRKVLEKHFADEIAKLYNDPKL